jgi:sugar lactone lactonase YvrE
MKRILVFGSCVILSCGVFQSTSRGGWTDGKAAVSVLGQPDFTSGSENQGLALPTAATISGCEGVALDPSSGKLFVVDTDNHRVLRYSSAAALTTGAGAEAAFGNVSLTAPGPGGNGRGQLFFPAGITVDSGGRLWVADNLNNRVLMYENAASAPSGALADGLLGAATFGSNPSGNGSGQMDQPQDVAVDAAGRLWVADWQNHRVLRFDNAVADAIANADDAGQNLALADAVLGQAGFDLSEVNRNNATPVRNGMREPFKLEIDDSGNLWVTDARNSRVLYFVDPGSKANGADADGLLGQANFTTSLLGAQPSRFWGPRGLAIDSRGALWVTEEFNHRTVRFENAASAALANAADPAGNVALPQGVLGQADFVSNLQSSSASGMISPYDIETSPYGDVWVAQRGNVNGGNRVSRHVPDADSYRVDGTVGRSIGTQRGNQIHNTSGAGQTLSFISRNRKKVFIHGAVGNDGEYGDDFRVTSPRGTRLFRVAIFSTSLGKRNITGAARTGSVEAGVLPGQSRRLLTEVTPTAATRDKVRRWNQTVAMTSVRGGNLDRVKASVKTTR